LRNEGLQAPKAISHKREILSSFPLPRISLVVVVVHQRPLHVIAINLIEEKQDILSFRSANHAFNITLCVIVTKLLRNKKCENPLCSPQTAFGPKSLVTFMVAVKDLLLQQ